jgi:hypothetical protein
VDWLGHCLLPLLVRTVAVCAAAALAYAVSSIALRLDGWQTILDRFSGLPHRLRGN